MATSYKNAQSIQVATRFKRDTYGLMRRDAGKFRGVSTVNNDIVEKHYEAELSELRKAAQIKPKNRRSKAATNARKN